MRINFEADDTSGPFFPSKPIDNNHLDMTEISFVPDMDALTAYPNPVYLRDIHAVEITETRDEGACIGLRFTKINWCWSVNWLKTKTGKRLMEAFQGQESLIRHLIFVTPNLRRITIITPERTHYAPHNYGDVITSEDRSRMMQVIEERGLLDDYPF